MPDPPVDAATERMRLLRTEAARAGQAGRTVRLSEVLAGVVQVAGELARERGITWEIAAQEEACCVQVDRVILRQVLLGLLNHLIARPHVALIQVDTASEGDTIRLALCARGEGSVASEDFSQGDAAARPHEPPPGLVELAATQGIVLRPGCDAGALGYALEFLARPPRLVLTVDDNQDILTLFGHYLAQGSYRAVPACSAAEALDLARTLQPLAVTLDIMMPERDGWEALQLLTNQAETQHIPVIVCTVLSAKELALSLGATAFLVKPVTERALLDALRALE
ncbi:MAG: response regulator [Chloroflexota bacterium]